MTLTESQRRAVRERAGDCCEYCRLPVAGGTIPFHVDHLRPVKHGGSDALDNLCWACLKCNTHKGTNLVGIDPETEEYTRLYNPRTQIWDEHFELDDSMMIVGLTSIGRTTVRVLQMNDEARLETRKILAEVCLYPCEGS